EPQQHRHVQRKALPRRAQVNVVASPELLPDQRVRGLERVEIAGARDRLAGGEPAFGYGGISGRVERSDLLDGRRLAFRQLDLELLRDVTLLLESTRRALEPLVADEDARARRDRDAQIRLARAHAQADAFVPRRSAGHGLEVTVVERPVELRAVVHDPPVEGRAERDPPGPVLRGQRELEPRE